VTTSPDSENFHCTVENGGLTGATIGISSPLFSTNVIISFHDDEESCGDVLGTSFVFVIVFVLTLIASEVVKSKKLIRLKELSALTLISVL
jgi:hypothetical protein